MGSIVPSSMEAVRKPYGKGKGGFSRTLYEGGEHCSRISDFEGIEGTGEVSLVFEWDLFTELASLHLKL